MLLTAAVTSSAFKDTQGRWRTKSLFVEFADPNYPFFFNLTEDDDPPNSISLKRKYLEIADPTEFLFARKVFGSYPCWERLLLSPEILNHVKQWRVELALKLEAEAVQTIRDASANGDRDSKVTAARNILNYLRDGRTKVPSKRDEDAPAKRGRPSNQPQAGGAAAWWPTTVTTNEDWNRLFGEKANTFTPNLNVTTAAQSNDNGN